jgi:succinyl-CoA synthetase alpha subunit
VSFAFAVRAEQVAIPIVGFVTGRSPEEPARLGAAGFRISAVQIAHCLPFRRSQIFALMV